MSVYVSPRTERRRRGRAIRKARREQATAALTNLDTFHAIDWTAVGRFFEALADTLVTVIDAALDAATIAARIFLDVFPIALAEERRRRRDWMLTYRALEQLDPERDTDA
ncbi:hypothetical protein M3D75_02930 [Microbacterium enclense]|uniref:hypothetical protein n=1 Tax=Microbacterium enclense TaxID=993073 RepID=UPI0021A8D99B|nr:hypothetical protein [Microbacterium enclense]MCT2085061.1 hypothetical protein [Microbacterium enclense]